MVVDKVAAPWLGPDTIRVMVRPPPFGSLSLVRGSICAGVAWFVVTTSSAARGGPLTRMLTLAVALAPFTAAVIL